MTIARRQLLGSAVSSLVALTVAGCGRNAEWHEQDISGNLPRLSLAMTDATDGKPVTAADFRGKVVLLYFGYTRCPDFCPTTLANIAHVLRELGSSAAGVRVLFVTVDPDRDSLATLKRYAALFAPQLVGLRGTPDQLAELARRYRVAYSVSGAFNDHSYEVTHSSIVYVFDQGGHARLLVSSMATASPDIDGTAADLKRLVAQGDQPGLWREIIRRV